MEILLKLDWFFLFTAHMILKLYGWIRRKTVKLGHLLCALCQAGWGWGWGYSPHPHPPPTPPTPPPPPPLPPPPPPVCAIAITTQEVWLADDVTNTIFRAQVKHSVARHERLGKANQSVDQIRVLWGRFASLTTRTIAKHFVGASKAVDDQSQSWMAELKCCARMIIQYHGLRHWEP